jgi:hypothetical protein
MEKMKGREDLERINASRPSRGLPSLGVIVTLMQSIHPVLVTRTLRSRAWDILQF